MAATPLCKGMTSSGPVFVSVGIAGVVSQIVYCSFIDYIALALISVLTRPLTAEGRRESGGVCARTVDLSLGQGAQA